MEIYANSADRRVYLDVPVVAVPGTMNVKVVEDGVEIFDIPTVEYNSGRYGITIPFSLSQTERNLEVLWEFDYLEMGQTFQYSRKTQVEIISPILSVSEIKEIHPNATDDEVVRIEKATRHIINAHTGQTFGLFTGTVSVRGNGRSALQLPRRALSVSTVNDFDSRFFGLDGDGWILRYYAFGVPPVKADYYGLHQHVGGVIHNPEGVKLSTFPSTTTYKVKGEWGWYSVPSQVKEAAKLLVNDYACADAAYRDRYLASMAAADWRIQFQSGAYWKTGNVRADQLLSDFVLKQGWAVL